MGVRFPAPTQGQNNQGGAFMATLILQINGGAGEFKWYQALSDPTCHRAIFTVVDPANGDGLTLPVQILQLGRKEPTSTSWRFWGVIYDEDDNKWGDHHHRLVSGTYDLSNNKGMIKLHGRLVIRIGGPGPGPQNRKDMDGRSSATFEPTLGEYSAYCLPFRWRCGYLRTEGQVIETILAVLKQAGLSGCSADYDIKHFPPV